MNTGVFPILGLDLPVPSTVSTDWGFWQAVAALLSVGVVIVYTIFAILQWVQIRRQADSAVRQVEQMQGQLKVMREQSVAIKDQAEVMRRQLRTMETSQTLAVRSEQQILAVRGFLLAVRTEIHALKSRYEDEDLATVKNLKKGEAFDNYFPIQQQSYFTVYSTGAGLLGFVPDDKLRELIVDIYLTARMIIDAHIFNNRLIEERDKVHNERPINDTRERRLREASQALQGYGYNVRVNYEQADRLIAEFDARFDGVIADLDESARVWLPVTR